MNPNITRRSIRIILMAAIMLLALNINPGAAEKLSLKPLQEAAALIEMGTAFTYQGRLMAGTVPADGYYDFQFMLFDDAIAGSQIGSTITEINYHVTNGLFMAELDFSAGAFTGFKRWLDIAVKPHAIPGYTPLLPRQKINPTPYATFAGTIYRKTIIVKPVTPAGSASDNGQLLLDAFSAVSGAGWDDRYLIKVEPGMYNLGSNHLDMVPFVDLEGSGKGITIIYADGSDMADTGTVIAASDSEIRSLTILSLGVRPSGQKDYVTAVYVPQGVLVKISNVSLESYNGLISSRGIYTDGSPDGSGGFIAANAYLNEVSIISRYDGGISGDEQPEVIGIYNDDGSYIYANDSTIISTNGITNYGLYNLNATAQLETTEVNTESDDGVYATINSTGIFGEFSYVYVNNSTIKSENGFNNYGLYLMNTLTTLETTRVNIVSGFDGIDSICTGIYVNGGSSTLTMRNSSTDVSCSTPSSFFIHVNGIVGEDAGLIQLFDSTVSVTDGMKGYVTGIEEIGESQLLTLTNVKVDVFGDNITNYGIVSGVTPFIIRDSFIYARDGAQAIGLAVEESDPEAAPEGEVINTVIKVEAANTHNNPDPGANDSIGIRFVSDGKLTLSRDTIWVKLQSMGPEGNYGGVGVYVEEGALVMENGKINNEMYHASYMGVALQYASEFGNIAYINNSEIYSCLEDYCHPVAVNHDDPATVYGTVAAITSTLLSGGPVNRPPNAFRCMWVTDEEYDGYGWPDMGPVLASHVCP
jgi:hypothetical protein